MDNSLKSNAPQTSIAKALIIGIILIILSAIWVVGAENRIIWEITDFSLFPTVIFVIFVLALLNLAIVRFIGKSYSLSASDLTIIYSMLSIATSLFSQDMMRQLLPIMGY